MSQGHASIPQLLLENYKKLNLSDVEMMLIIHLHSFLSMGVDFPSIKQLEGRMTCSQLELTRMLNRLRKEGYIEIRSRIDDNQRMVEQYSLQPLWEKLGRYLTIHGEEITTSSTPGVWSNETSDQEEREAERNVFKRFEQELGRPLTPMECETISAWLDEDQLDPNIIMLALKEAVLANKRSLRYIDKILLEWQRNGLTSVQAVQDHIVSFRKKQVAKLDKAEPGRSLEFPFYNWLER
jgi:DNA replication protein